MIFRMTSANQPDRSIGSVFLWMGKPTDGSPEHLLMVLHRHPEHGPSWTPLLATDLPHAHRLRSTAAEAADTLGAEAVLRQYDVVSFAGHPHALDSITPASL